MGANFKSKKQKEMKVLIFSIILTVSANGFPVYGWQKTGEMEFNSISHLESFLRVAHSQEIDSFFVFEGGEDVFQDMSEASYEKKSTLEAARIIWAGGQVFNSCQTVYYKIDED